MEPREERGKIKEESSWGDESMIVLDDNGERVTKPMPTSFLRDIDEL